MRQLSEVLNEVIITTLCVAGCFGESVSTPLIVTLMKYPTWIYQKSPTFSIILYTPTTTNLTALEQ